MTKIQRVELQLRRSIECALARGDLVTTPHNECSDSVIDAILGVFDKAGLGVEVEGQFFNGWDHTWAEWTWEKLGARLRRDYCEFSAKVTYDATANAHLDAVDKQP